MFVLLLARTARFETFRWVTENRTHSSHSQPQPPRPGLGNISPQLLPSPSSLSLSPYAACVSRFSFQLHLWSASLLLLAWLVKPDTEHVFVSFLFDILDCFVKTWRVSPPTGSWCFILPLDLFFWFIILLFFSLYSIGLERHNGLRHLRPYGDRALISSHDSVPKWE